MRHNDTHPGRIGAVAARLGLSEGQAYTVTILLVVAALLTSSLTGLTGRIAEVTAAPFQPSEPTTSMSTATTTTMPVPPPPRTRAGQPASTTTAVAPSPTTTPAFAPAGPFEPLVPDAPPTPAPCPSAPLIAAARDTLALLDSLTGGLVPDSTVVSALAIATGCSNTDPAILLLAGLVEIGQGIPDLGLGILQLPVLPFLEIPGLVVELVQPLRALLDPICETVGTVSLITSQVGPAYPPPLDAAFSVSLFYALATCGQLQSR